MRMSGKSSWAGTGRGETQTRQGLGGGLVSVAVASLFSPCSPLGVIACPHPIAWPGVMSGFVASDNGNLSDAIIRVGTVPP